MVLNQKGGTKCATCDTEQLGHERKLDLSVSADGNEALESSSIRAGGLKFGGLGLKGHPARSAVRNIFEGSCTEEGTVAEKDIFGGGFKFAVSEARKKFDSTDSAVQREEDHSASPYTQ